MTSAVTPPASGTMEIVVDAIDFRSLRPEDLPATPSQLPCGRCGATWGQHGSSPGHCPAFQRPQLPKGYRYVDELQVGERFRFFSRRHEDCGRTVLNRDCCVADHLLRVESVADRCEPATHWLQDTTIVTIG